MSRAALAAEPRTALRLALAVAIVVTAVDLGSKVLATWLLADRALTMPGGVFLAIVYNDSFARGMELGALTLPATLAVAAVVLSLAAWIGASLTRFDHDAPLALGLIAGATIANASDYVRTGRGVVDFLGVSTGADSGVVFNLADVAAYLGVILLARTAFRLCTAIVAQRRTVPASDALRVATSRAIERSIERPLPLPVVVDGLVIRHADSVAHDRDDDTLSLPLDSAARTARGITAPAPPQAVELRLPAK